MAPMIDMVFLLLVFFMTVSTLAREARPELDLALSRTARVPEEAPPRDILTVLRDDTGSRIYWRNRQVELDQLETLLRESARNPDSQLLLRGGPELPWSEWQRILALVREAGIRDLVFATFEE